MVETDFDNMITQNVMHSSGLIVRTHIAIIEVYEILVNQYGKQKAKLDFTDFFNQYEADSEKLEQILNFLNGFAMVDNYEQDNRNPNVYTVHVNPLTLSHYVKHYGQIGQLKYYYTQKDYLSCFQLIQKIFRLEGSAHCNACCPKSEGDE